MFLKMKKVWKKAVAIIAVGAAAFLLMGTNDGAAGGRFISDMLFTIGMVFFFLGCLHLLGNMGMFNSFAYGAKCLFRVIRNRKVSSGEMRDGFIDYINSRPKHTDVPTMMVFTAGFVLLSVATALLMA